MKSVILPVARSILTVSLTLITGSGYRILNSVQLHQYLFYSFFSNQTLVQRLIDEQRNLRASIMRNQEWDPLPAQLNSLDFSKFVFCFCSLNPMDGESTFGIVDKSEVFAGLFDADHIHKTSRVSGISSDLAVDFDKALHEDSLCLTAIEGVLQAVSNENDQR
jgi:hypothetical protein